MALLGRRQIAQKLAGGGIAGAFGRLHVEAMGLFLHVLGGIPHPVDAQRPHQPVGLALIIAAHMLAPDQRNRLAETPAMHLDQRPPVPVLLVGHVVEDFCRLRKTLPQPRRISPINPPVILLGRDRQREDFLLGKGIERTAREAEDAR